ncbi:MAG TPA: DUF86 domain-containing protein [Pyrinomonadaceae bacterium]|nr:DUF86 domain-containing protein [Pyrinomonadaceae bacterium]HMP65901.1 DUF86 domain-containing protein [Pyrinomonadaceae bacterium]
MALSTNELVKHILDETRFLQEQTSGLEKGDYLEDEVRKRAFVRSIEIIGEAVKKLPADFRDKYPHIEWRLIAGMRDKLIHEYFGIDHDIVWDVATNKAVELERALSPGD